MSSRLVLALIFVVTSTSARADTPASTEEDAWKSVQEAFNRKDWVLTVVEGDDFARRFPKSERSAQALYQAGCSYLMMQKPNEAAATFKRLVSDHFDSPWTNWALQLHLDAAALLGLADELRSQGRPYRTPALLQRAAGLYILFSQRFPNDNRVRGEVVYKWADCMRCLGKDQDARAAFKNLANVVQDDWNKLAAFQVGGCAEFQKGMNDLLDLSTNGEERTLFLDLAERFHDGLSKPARVECQYLRGHCLDGAARVNALRRFCKEHLDSPWLSEAAFYLAEYAFENGKRTEAQEVYRALAARHPDNPRAKRLAAWADWIDRQQADQKELERLFVDCLKKFDSKKGGLAFSIHVEADALSFPIDGRLAYCDRQVLMRAELGGAGFACGLQRPNVNWYRFLNQDTMHRVEKSALPLLALKVLEFPKGSINFQWGMAMNPDPAAASSIEIDPAAGALLAAKFTGSKHFHRQPRADGGADFVFQWPQRNPAAEQTLTVCFSAQGKPQNLTYRSANAAGKKLTVAVNDVVFGDAIPTEQFAMPTEPGVEIRSLKEVNQLEVLAQIMNLCGPAYQTLIKELPKTR